jgi:membrane protein DedA with SNARE-associated domain
MLTLVAVSVFVNAVLGAGLGFFLVRVWALVPAALFALAFPSLSGLSRDTSMISTALAMVVAVAGLQLGYLAGAFLSLWKPRRQTMTLSRDQETSVSEAPLRRAGACALSRHRDR